jgi:hypothetical protein
MKWMISILIALPAICAGQGNLVPNGSFEDVTSCPWESGLASLAFPWAPPLPSSADLFNVCNLGTPSGSPHLGIPENSAGYQHAHSGEGYVGIFTYNGAIPDGREYMQVQLLEPLNQGGYVVSFWVSLADEFQYAVGSLGAYLSDTLISYTGYSPYQVEPSIQSPDGVIMSDKDIWYHVTDTFKSRYGGEQYLLIGNFKTAEESDTLLVPTGANNRFQSYYYIDDVSVVALDTVSGIGETEQIAFSMYPNPVVERVNIAGKERLHHVALFDIRGRKIMEEDAHNQKHTIDLKGIPEGVYLLRVTDDEGHTATQRLVKAAGL